MKRILFLVFCLLVAGCCRQPSITVEQEEAYYSIEGTYRIESIAWDGLPLDLDNDGNSSVDLYDELKGFALVDIGDEAAAVVQSNSLDFPSGVFDGSVSIALPFQGVERSSSSAGGISCAPDGLRWFASLMFVIDLDGAVSFDVISDLGLSDDDHRLDVSYIRDAKLKKTGSGRLQLSADWLFYDYATSSVVTGGVTVSYVRTGLNIHKNALKMV
ncbi:MAG: hypothetical protein OSJ55_07120 [Bacteroidales bacterium]|nr:hypothetical protein [Bacteroidales bacterium]